MKVELILGCWGREKNNFCCCSGTSNVILDITKNTNRNTCIAEFLDKTYGLFDKPLYNNVHTAIWSIHNNFSEVGDPVFSENLFKQMEEFCILHKKCGTYLRLNMQEYNILGDVMNNNVIILDIDGTICDSNARIKEMCNSAGYEFTLNNVDKIFSSENIKMFFLEEEVEKDQVIKGSEKVLCLAKKLDAQIYIITGRSGDYRDITQKWLVEKFKLPLGIPMYMRTEEFKETKADIYKDSIFVNNILNRHPNTIFWFFDDDESILEKYSKYGVSFKAPGCWGNIEC